MISIQANKMSATLTTAADGLSSVVDLQAYTLMGIIMPSTWATAGITFKVSESSGGTFYDLYDDAGNEVSASAANGRSVSLDSIALKLAPFRYIKMRSGTTATPVAQSTNVTITLLVKG